ncbi:MAG: selenoneine synthase SenA [Alphaproteobacteria bacterium]
MSIEHGGPLAGVNRRNLIEWLRAFRARTLALVQDLSDAQMIGPRLSIVNPPLWEIGHVAWFQEFWVLRHLLKQKPMIENGDQLYNSTDVAHDTRWELRLPRREQTLRYMEEVLSRCIETFDRSEPLAPDALYFYLLVAFHESMHAEALAYTRQTLGYPAPACAAIEASDDHPGFVPPGDVEIPGGTFLIGATVDFPFIFDNEKWAHPVTIAPFRIARTSVTNGEYRVFVEDGGYRNVKFWSREGWKWLERGGAPQLERSFAKFFNKNMHEPTEVKAFAERLDHPVYWRRDPNGRWQQRLFDRYVPLRESYPVVHVSWFEAQAYCHWAERRLPTEAEWEVAASGEFADNRRTLSQRRRHFPWGDQSPDRDRANLDWSAGGPVTVNSHPSGDSAFGCRQMVGNIWEWTADDFTPYPGFTIDPYKEYSKPWFGTHKVLRGGCWATSSLLIRNTWRNFYTPDRRDVWAGFRTCAQ